MKANYMRLGDHDHVLQLTFQLICAPCNSSDAALAWAFELSSGVGLHFFFLVACSGELSSTSALADSDGADAKCCLHRIMLSQGWPCKSMELIVANTVGICLDVMISSLSFARIINFWSFIGKILKYSLRAQRIHVFEYRAVNKTII